MVVIAAVAVGGASLSAFAADWAEEQILVTLTKLSTGQVFESVVTGQVKDEETLYLEVADVFGEGGVAADVVAEWTVRNGKVYFPVGNAVRSVEIETVGGHEYVPVLETLGKLGVSRGLADRSHLMVEVW